MFNCNYVLFVTLLSNVYSINLLGDNKFPRDISNEDFTAVDNDIKNSKVMTFKEVTENNALDHSDGSIEEVSPDKNKVYKEIQFEMYDSGDDNEVKRNNNDIDDFAQVTIKTYINATAAGYTVTATDDGDTAVTEAETFTRNYTTFHETTEQSIEDKDKEQEKRRLFKNCRYGDNDERCRSTLIDYPYVVSIQKLGSHYATGALLDSRWILTVAGEFYNIRESIKFFRARLGSANCKRNGVLVPLQEIIIHPLFVPGKSGYDLALLRAGEAVRYTDYIRPIRLSEEKENVLSAKFTTTYWPRVLVKGQLLKVGAPERVKSNNLRVSKQQVVGGQYCHKMMLEMNERLSDGSLCLKPLVTHHSLCMPDPGAPLVADERLWGITSGWTSRLCYESPGPTVFTLVSSPLVRSWLNSKLQSRWVKPRP